MAVFQHEVGVWPSLLTKEIVFVPVASKPFGSVKKPHENSVCCSEDTLSLFFDFAHALTHTRYFSKSWPHAEKEQERGSEREIKNAMACYRTGLTKTPSVCHVMKYMAQPTHNGYIP